MVEINKNLVLDKTNTPIAVLISYDQWLKIEKIINEHNKKKISNSTRQLVAGGSLEKFKDIKKIPLEKDAWERAIIDEYENS